MDKETIARYAASLDTLLNKDENGVEFWHARELMKYMGYTKWENFTKVIQRARSACQNAGQPSKRIFATPNGTSSSAAEPSAPSMM